MTRVTRGKVSVRCPGGTSELKGRATPARKSVGYWNACSVKVVEIAIRPSRRTRDPVGNDPVEIGIEE